VIREGSAESVYALRSALTPHELALSIDIEERGAPGAGVARGERKTLVGMNVGDPDKQLFIAKLVLHTLDVAAELGADGAGVVVHLDDCRRAGANQTQVTSPFCALIGREGQGAARRKNEEDHSNQQHCTVAPLPSGS